MLIIRLKIDDKFHIIVYNRFENNILYFIFLMDLICVTLVNTNISLEEILRRKW